MFFSYFLTFVRQVWTPSNTLKNKFTSNQKLTPDLSNDKNFIDDLLFLKYRISFLYKKNYFSEAQGFAYFFKNNWRSLFVSACKIPCNYFFLEINIPNNSE